MQGSVYRFEQIDEALDLVPLAGRRALDRVGRKLGLEAWRRLPLAARTAIVEAGAKDAVDAARVLALLTGAETSPVEGRPEPSPSSVPPAVAALSPSLPAERWAALRALDRWALESLAARGRGEAFAALVAELSPPS